MLSIVTEARDQTLPGSLLARETLGTRLCEAHDSMSFVTILLFGLQRIMTIYFIYVGKIQENQRFHRFLTIQNIF